MDMELDADTVIDEGNGQNGYGGAMSAWGRKRKKERARTLSQNWLVIM